MFKTSPREERRARCIHDEEDFGDAFNSNYIDIDDDDTVQRRPRKIDYRSRSFQSASPTYSPSHVWAQSSGFSSGHGWRNSGNGSGHEKHGKEHRIPRCSSSINLQSSPTSRHINVVKAQLTLDIPPITSNLPSSGRRKKKSSKPSLACSLSKLNSVNAEVKERKYSAPTQQPTKKFTYQEYAEVQLALTKAQEKEKKKKLDKRSLSHDCRFQNKSQDGDYLHKDDFAAKNKKKTSCHSNFLYTTSQEQFNPPENLRISSGPKPGTVSINAEIQTSPSSVDLLDLESGARVSTCELDSLHLLQQRFLEGRTSDVDGFSELGLVGRSNKKNRGPRLVRQTAATIDCVHVDQREDDCTNCIDDPMASDIRVPDQHRKSSGSVRAMETPEIKISFTPGDEPFVEHSNSRASNLQCKCIECYIKNSQNSFIVESNEVGNYRTALRSDTKSNLKNGRTRSFDSRSQLKDGERETLSSYKSRSFDCHTHGSYLKTPDDSMGNPQLTAGKDSLNQSSYHHNNESKLKSKSFDMPGQNGHSGQTIKRGFKSDRCLYNMTSSRQNGQDGSNKENVQLEGTLENDVHSSLIKNQSPSKQSALIDFRRHSGEPINISSMQRPRNHSACDELLLNPSKFHDDRQKTGGNNTNNLLHPGMISGQRSRVGCRRNRSRSMEDTAKIGDGFTSLSKSFDERMCSTKNSRNVKNYRNMKAHQRQRERNGDDTSSDEDINALSDLDKEMNSQSDMSLKRQEIRKRRQCYTNSKQPREYGSQEMNASHASKSINDTCQPASSISDAFPTNMGSSFHDRLLRKSFPNDSNNTYLKCSNEKLDELRKKSRSFDGCNSLHPSSALDDISRNQRVLVSKEVNTMRENNGQFDAPIKENVESSRRHGPVQSKSFQQSSENKEQAFNYEDLNGNPCVYQSRSCEGRLNTKNPSLQSNDSMQETQSVEALHQSQQSGSDKLFMKKYIPYMTRISHDSSVETSVDSNEYEYDLKSSYGKTRSFDERISREDQIRVEQHQTRSHSFSLHQTHASALDPFNNYTRRSFDTGYLYPGRSDSSVNNSNDFSRRKHSNNRVISLLRGDINAPRKRHSYSNAEEYSASRRRVSGGRDHSIPSRASSSSQGDSSHSGDAPVYADSTSGRRARSFDIYDAKTTGDFNTNNLAMGGRFCVNSDGYLSTRRAHRIDPAVRSRSVSTDDERSNYAGSKNGSFDRETNLSRSPLAKQKFPRRQEAQDDGTFHQDMSDRHKDNRCSVANSDGDLSNNQEPKSCGILTCRCYRRQSSPQKVYPENEATNNDVRDRQFISNLARRSYSADSRNYSLDAPSNLRNSDQSSKSCEYVTSNKHNQSQFYCTKGQSAGQVDRGMSDTTKPTNSSNYKIGKNNQLTVCFSRITKKSKSLETTSSLDRNSPVGKVRSKSPPAVRSLDRDILLYPSVERTSSPEGSSGSSSMNSQRSRNQKRLEVENVPSPIIIISPCTDEMFGHNPATSQNEYSRDCVIASSPTPEVKQQTQIDYLPGEKVKGDNHVFAKTDRRKGGGITSYDEKIRLAERNDKSNRQAANATKGDNRENRVEPSHEKALDERTLPTSELAQSCLAHASSSSCVSTSCPKGFNKGQRVKTRGENDNTGEWNNKGIRTIVSRDGGVDASKTEMALANLPKSRVSGEEDREKGDGVTDDDYTVICSKAVDGARKNSMENISCEKKYGIHSIGPWASSYDDGQSNECCATFYLGNDETHYEFTVTDRNKECLSNDIGKNTESKYENSGEKKMQCNSGSHRIQSDKYDSHDADGLRLVSCSGVQPCVKCKEDRPESCKDMQHLTLSPSANPRMHHQSHDKRQSWLNNGERRGKKERDFEGVERDSQIRFCKHGNVPGDCSLCHVSKSVDHDFHHNVGTTPLSSKTQIVRTLSCNYDEQNSRIDFGKRENWDEFERENQTENKKCGFHGNKSDGGRGGNFNFSERRSGGGDEDKKCVTRTILGEKIRGNSNSNIRDKQLMKGSPISRSQTVDHPLRSSQQSALDTMCNSSSLNRLTRNGGCGDNKGRDVGGVEGGSSDINRHRHSDPMRGTKPSGTWTGLERQLRKMGKSCDETRTRERRKREEKEEEEEGGKKKEQSQEDIREKAVNDKEEEGKEEEGGGSVCGLSPTHPVPRFPSSRLTSKHSSHSAHSAHCKGTCGAGPTTRTEELATTTKTTTRKRPVTYCRAGAGTANNTTTTFSTTTAIVTTTTTTTTAAASVANSSIASSAPSFFYSSASVSSSSSPSSLSLLHHHHHRHHPPRQTQSLLSNTYSCDGDEAQENRTRDIKGSSCVGLLDSSRTSGQTVYHEDNSYNNGSSQKGIFRNSSDHQIRHPGPSSYHTPLARNVSGNDIVPGEKRSSEQRSSFPRAQSGDHHRLSSSSSSLQFSSSSQPYQSKKTDNHKDGHLHNSSDALKSAKGDKCDKKNSFRYLQRPKLLGDTFRQRSLPSWGAGWRNTADDNSNSTLQLQHSSTDPELSPVARVYSNVAADRNLIGLECNCMHANNSRGVQDNNFIRSGTCGGDCNHTCGGVLGDCHAVSNDSHQGSCNNDQNSDAPVISVSGYNSRISNSSKKNTDRCHGDCTCLNEPANGCVLDKNEDDISRSNRNNQKVIEKDSERNNLLGNKIKCENCDCRDSSDLKHFCHNKHNQSSNCQSCLQPSCLTSTTPNRHCLRHGSCLRSRSADVALCSESEELSSDVKPSETLRVGAHPPHQSHSFDEIIHLNKIKSGNTSNNNSTYCDSWINDNNNDFGLSQDTNSNDNINFESNIDDNCCCHHHHHHHHNNPHQHHLQHQSHLNTRSSSFDLDHTLRCGQCTQLVKADIHAGGFSLLTCSNDNSSSNNNVQTSNEIGSFSSRDTVIYQPTNDTLANDNINSSVLDITFSLVRERKATDEERREEDKQDENKSDSEDIDVEATPLLTKPMAGACPDGRGIEIIVSDENDARVSTVQTGKGAIFRRIWLVLLDNRMAGRPDAESAIQPQPDEYRLLKKTLNIVFIVVGIALLVSVFVVIAYTYAADPDDQRDITGRGTEPSEHGGVHIAQDTPPLIPNNITETTTSQ